MTSAAGDRAPLGTTVIKKRLPLRLVKVGGYSTDAGTFSMQRLKTIPGAKDYPDKFCLMPSSYSKLTKGFAFFVKIGVYFSQKGTMNQYGFTNAEATLDLHSK